MNKNTLILLFLPALLALGFDVYLYYLHQERGFMLTDIGWLWQDYDKEGLNALKTSLAESNPTLSILLTELILKQKTVLILAIIGAFIGALIWIYQTFLKSSPEKQVKSMIKKAPPPRKKKPREL